MNPCAWCEKESGIFTRGSHGICDRHSECMINHMKIKIVGAGPKAFIVVPLNAGYPIKEDLTILLGTSPFPGQYAPEYLFDTLLPMGDLDTNNIDDALMAQLKNIAENKILQRHGSRPEHYHIPTMYQYTQLDPKYHDLREEANEEKRRL